MFQPNKQIKHAKRLKEIVVPTKKFHCPCNPTMQATINNKVNAMLGEKVIKPSIAPDYPSVFLT